MNILNTFLQLTSKTYPYGFEEELEKYLPKDIQRDSWGNYFLKIGESKTVFASHLDTACKDQVDVQHRIQGNIIKTDGKSVLGADDKAGVTVLLYLIEKKIPGLYYFFIGEEVGCIGSGNASNDELFKKYDRIISFDRRGTDSIITHQSSLRCCSNGFAERLCGELNRSGFYFKIDETGVYTDSAEFTSVIPECTNISVGYYKEHTHQEHQDIDHLRKLCRAAAQVDWEKLPTIRDASSKEYIYNHPHRKTRRSHDDRWGEYYDSRYGGEHKPRTRRSSKKKQKVWKNPDYKPKSYYNDLDHYVDGGSVKKLDPLVDYSRSEDFLTNNYSNTFSLSHQTNYMKPLKPLIFNDKLTADELNILADQYFDLKDEQDLDFYSYLKKNVTYHENYL
jgi:hypothetical protein